MKREVAGFPKRIIAYLIDLLIINSLLLRPFGVFSKNMNFGLKLAFSKEGLIIGLSTALITLLYWTLLEFLVRQSIGKIIVRIYVSSKTKTLTLQQCIIRNISKIAPPILLIDVLYAIVKKTNQRYFEKISNTEVLKVKLK